jgi:hypothetical protein
VIYELRIYTVKPGAMDEWIAEWRGKIRPLRERAGFAVLGPWVADDSDQFLWILGHADFEAADAAYYQSAARVALDPDPARHLLEVEQRRMREP